MKGGEAGTISKKDIVNMIRRRRKIGEDLPPIYPNGWFRLLDSHQLKNGEVKEVCALGKCRSKLNLFCINQSLLGNFHTTNILLLSGSTCKIILILA